MNYSCQKHNNHPHKHGEKCGHTAILHNGHIDYLHDGHLHHIHDDHVDEHVIEVSDKNPETGIRAKDCGCSPECSCESCADESCSCDCCDSNHEKGHIHGEGCGHEAIPHGDHVDYLVNGRLHHQKSGYCEDHGFIEVVA